MKEQPSYLGHDMNQTKSETYHSNTRPSGVSESSNHHHDSKRRTKKLSTQVCLKSKARKERPRDDRLIERKKKVNEREDTRLMRKLRKRKREELRSNFMVHSKVYCNIIKKSDSLFQVKRFEMSFKNYVDGVSF